MKPRHRPVAAADPSTTQTLNRRIDNGSHVLLGANPAAFAYLDMIGASDTLRRLDSDGYPFADMQSGERWTFRPGRPVPGVGPLQYFNVLSLLTSASGRTVEEALGDGVLSRRLWSPMTLAVLNTLPQEASALLLRRALVELVRRGSKGFSLHMARDGLSESFVDPALHHLQEIGSEIICGQRLTKLVIADDRVTGLEFGASTVDVRANDRVVLAVGPKHATDLLPGLLAPAGANAVVNGHFLVDKACLPLSQAPVTGLVGSTAHWLFWRDDVVSATMSAANGLAAKDNAEIAELLWRDIAQTLDLGEAPLPLFRVVKEKSATFAQTPANDMRRPKAQTGLSNLYLAGDWIDTGLPACIESAIRSGNHAAALACAS